MEEPRQLKEANTPISKDVSDPGVIQRLVASYRRSGDADGRIHLRDYLQAIRKHLWLIAGLTVLVVMVTVIYLARQPDIFLAQSLVQIDVEDLNPALNNNKNNSVIVNNSSNDPAYFNTQLRILTSYGLLSRVVKTLDLEHNQGFTNPKSVKTRSTWQNVMRMVGLGKKTKPGEVELQDKNKLPVTSSAGSLAVSGGVSGNTATSNPATNPEEAERYAPLVKDLQESLQIEPVVERRMGYGRDTTRLIEIRYKHPDPRLAARIVNTVAETLALMNLERRSDKSVSTSDFLQKRIAELQMQIRNSEERLLNYAKSNQILSLDASQNTVVERLTGLNRQLLEAENERKLAESSWQAARAPGAAVALAEETISKQATDIKNRLAELRQKRAQLLVESTEKYPEVIEIKQQIATLEQELQSAIARAAAVVLSNLETRYRQALQREQAVRSDFDKQRGTTLTQNEAAVNYRIIQQEIETNKGLLNGLLQSYKENDVVLAGLHNNVSVIDYAIPPDIPIGPKRWQGVMLALIFAIPCGIGLVLLLEYLNDTIRSIDDVEKLLRLPALAAIPAVRGGRTGRSALLLSDKSPPAAAEAYRQLRTAVLLSTPGGAPQTVLVTSSVPGEGKTTSSVNLAVSLSQTKAKVLLIDADLRRPRLHTIFGLDNRRGLSTYLSSEAPATDLAEIVQQHKNSNLFVLTSGPIPPNPAELLGSEQMQQLLERLKAEFTYIVIDSAPSASFTDAVLLSSMVDGLLMVVHSNSTPRQLVLRTKHLLAAAGAKIFGVVLSQVVMSSQDAIYGSYLYQKKENGQLGESEAATSLVTLPDAAKQVIDFKKKENELVTEVDSTNSTPAPAESAQATKSAPVSKPAKVPNVKLVQPAANGSNGAVTTIPRMLNKVNGSNGSNGDPVSPFAWERSEAGQTFNADIVTGMAAAALVNDVANNLVSVNPEQSYAAYSMLFLMAKAGAHQPMLRLIEEHPDEKVRLALIKLLGASGDAKALLGLIHLAAHTPLPSAVLTATLTAIDQLASQTPSGKAA